MTTVVRLQARRHFRSVVIPSPPRWSVWAVLLAAGLAYEFHEIRTGPDGFPLSRVIRRTFRTDTPTGAAVFTFAVEKGSGWLVGHILGTTVLEPEGTTTTEGTAS